MELFTQAALRPGPLFARGSDVIPGGVRSAVRVCQPTAATPEQRRRGAPGARRWLCGLSSPVPSGPEIIGVGFGEPVGVSEPRVTGA